eukprot:14594799-Alexandrium_andersonii.AAC.1
MVPKAKTKGKGQAKAAPKTMASSVKAYSLRSAAGETKSMRSAAAKPVASLKPRASSQRAAEDGISPPQGLPRNCCQF